MTEQLALDVGTRPVARSLTGVFTRLQFAAAASLTRDEAQAYIEEFEATGVVERVTGGWRVTAAGGAIARGLALVDDRDVHDHDNQQEEVTERSAGDMK